MYAQIEGALARERFVEHGAEREQIAAMVRRFAGPKSRILTAYMQKPLWRSAARLAGDGRASLRNVRVRVRSADGQGMIDGHPVRSDPHFADERADDFLALRDVERLGARA